MNRKRRIHDGIAGAAWADACAKSVYRILPGLLYPGQNLREGLID